MRRRQPGEFSWAIFFRGIARALGLRPRREALPDAEDTWARSSDAFDQDRLGRMLDRMRHDALAIYAQHALPTLVGHYARAPGQSQWTLIAERLSPEERWAMLAQYPPQDGWRFASLEDLGRDSPDEDLAGAARVLAHVIAVTSPDTRDPPRTTLERAVALGVEWQALSIHGALDIQTVRPQPLDRPDPTTG